MRQKTAKWKLIGVALSLMISCWGCSGQISVVNRKGEEEVLHLGEQCITVGEMNLIKLDYEILYTENYAAAFGDEFWNVDTGDGVCLADYVKENVLWIEMAELVSLCELASEQEIVLSQEEQEQARAAGAAYYQSLDTSLAKELYVTEESSISLMEKYQLARKVIEQIQGEKTIEISENEARVIAMQQLEFDTQEDALAAYEAIVNEETSWEELTGNKNLETVQVARGEYLETIEQAVFSLETGEVSKPIYALEHYYLFYCMDDHLVGESAQNRVSLLEQYNYDVWSEATQTLMEQKKLYLNSSLWDTVTFVVRDRNTAQSFRQCYEENMM
ncbi:MAG: hypothetical protein ACI4C1_02015 [Lachnospiraceae bacterium]